MKSNTRVKRKKFTMVGMMLTLIVFLAIPYVVVALLAGHWDMASWQFTNWFIFAVILLGGVAYLWSK